jgi:hypothetical protein
MRRGTNRIGIEIKGASMNPNTTINNIAFVSFANIP